MVPSPRRGRDIHELHRTATPLELLFDLTFVVAIALAAAELHHGLAEHHVFSAYAGFLGAFFGIWWAWVNYTWYASAYDNDDIAFRLLTMVQMVGVLVFAVGIPGIFDGQWEGVIGGYVLMRLALVVQWLLAAHGDRQRRRTCLRYAIGVSIVQVLWVAWLWVPDAWSGIALAVFVVGELLVPGWAERAERTPWHPHHIAERFGLLVIITLGECVLGAANAIASLWRVDGWSGDLALVGMASMLLILCLWWMYFQLPSGAALQRHREWAFAWGYGHFFLFLGLAAMGAGLEVVADTLNPGVVTPGAAAPPIYAILVVALPEALFIICLWLLYGGITRSVRSRLPIAVLCVACIAVVPMAMMAGLPLPWALLLLSLGPLLVIGHHVRATARPADTLQSPESNQNQHRRHPHGDSS
ncbi:MAG: low temperature requirement protein A [Sinobacteraceae bacterium]|nr:low temperature requirement protein A [Nevskiaceae bacterium]